MGLEKTAARARKRTRSLSWRGRRGSGDRGEAGTEGKRVLLFLFPPGGCLRGGGWPAERGDRDSSPGNRPWEIKDEQRSKRGEVRLFLRRRQPEREDRPTPTELCHRGGSMARPGRSDGGLGATERSALLPAGGDPGPLPLRPVLACVGVGRSHIVPNCAQGLGGAPGQVLRRDLLGEWMTTNKTLLGG